MNAQQATLERLQEDRRNTPTGMIYHYTNKAGLEGITASGNFWLSDYTKMPDTGEISYGFNIGLQILRQAFEDGPRTGRLRRFVAGTEAGAKDSLRKFFRAYILSLSPRGDVLTQWREYGEHEAGFCLGFNGRTLDAAFVEFRKDAGLEAGGSFKVLYDEKRLRRLMKRYVDNALTTVMWLSERPGHRRAAVDAMMEIGKNLTFAFIFTALFFKDPHYHSEDEYRFLVMTFPDKRIRRLKSRPSPRGKVGYFEFDWKKRRANALKVVRIGPARKEVEGHRIVKRALGRAKMVARVEKSRITQITRPKR